MRRITLVTAALLLLFSAAAAFAADQLNMRWRGSGGWGPGSDYSKLYDPKSVETVRGTIKSLETVVPIKGMFQGVSLILDTGRDEPLPVHLGPVWYMENQDMVLRPGDNVEVKGSMIDLGKGPVMIAAEVRKGVEVLRLRDGKGRPAWSGLP